MPERQFNPEEPFKSEIGYRPNYNRIEKVLGNTYSFNRQDLDGRTFAVGIFTIKELLNELMLTYTDQELMHKKEIFKAVYLPKIHAIEKAENGDPDSLLDLFSEELVSELDGLVKLEALNNTFTNASKDLANIFREFSSNTRFFTAWSAAFIGAIERGELDESVLIPFVDFLGKVRKSTKDLNAMIDSPLINDSEQKGLLPRLATIELLCENLSFLQKLLYPIKRK